MENKKENRQRLVCCIMGQNAERFIGMCLESVKDSDAIIYCDGGSIDNTLDIVDTYHHLHVNEGFELQVNIIKNEYIQEDKGMNGKQRNFYLNYLKENYLGWYCLVLDADEVLDTDGIKRIKEFISNNGIVWDVHMRHFHENLGKEDATVERHYVPRRLFEVTEDLNYPTVEHPILLGDFKEVGKCEVTIFHLAHINHCFNIKSRYEKNMKHSNIHNPEFLQWWLKSHIFGQYPNKPVNLLEIPAVILKNFHIEPDEIYFANRGIEMKHPLQVKQWYDYFKPMNLLDLGCGKGTYLYFWQWFIPAPLTQGYELSKWAIDNAFCKGIFQKDISENWIEQKWDLITAIDVLEHLTDEQLNRTLQNMASYGKQFIFSIPFAPNDSNLYNDKTHKQFKTKEEWIKLIENYGIKIKETPSDWLFANQILIGEK